MSAPQVEIDQVTAVTKRYFGKDACNITSLGSCQDANFKVKCSDGSKYVMKFLNSACTRAELSFQLGVIHHLSSSPTCAHIICPFPISLVGDANEYIAEILIGETIYFGVLLTYVSGRMLNTYKYFSHEVLFNFGAVAGTVTSCLSNLAIPGADRNLIWDLRRADDVIAELLPSVKDTAQRSQLASIASNCAAIVAPLRAALRIQTVHGDLAHYNVVSKQEANGRPSVCGVIDFGDAQESWVVGDLAIAILSGFACNENGMYAPILDACHVLRGYHSKYPLNRSEVLALWPLILIRSVVNIVAIQSELVHDPSNKYNLEGLAVEWFMFNKISNLPISLGQEALCAALGIDAELKFPIIESCGDMLVDIDTNQRRNAVILDLTVQSPLFRNYNWKCSADVRKVIQQHLDKVYETNPLAIVVVPHGLPQLHTFKTHSLHAPPTVSLAIEIFLPVGTAVATPFDCEVSVKHSTDHSFDGNIVIVHGNKFDIILRGVVCSGSITPHHCSMGEVVGTVTAAAEDDSLPARLSVQVCLDPTVTDIAPLRCAEDMFAAWNHICPSASSLLGIMINISNNTPDNVLEIKRLAALEKRNQYVASCQQHYYKIPPQIERGCKEFLIDTAGRSYVDMVNNVAVLGHCHEAVTKAAVSQMDLLNTNSRFIYSKFGDYAEKIVSRIPAYAKDKLNVVLFVNSGSEATDLAMRIARTVVNERRRAALHSRELSSVSTSVIGMQRDVICLEGAYHGITTASDEISTTLNDNPRSRETRPPWVHLVPMPNAYRDCDANLGDKYAEYVRNKITEMKDKGTPPTCFIAEPLSGNAGGVELPQGYLQQVYEEIRSVGGLCIADEVQVGYGRLGSHFWGFMEHGVVPDLLTMAKAAGNGHPIGYVVTSKEIAAEFEAEGSLFSSAGGGPVGCAIGMAVLDTVEKEGLMQNAAEVGAYLHSRLLELAQKYPTIGHIHGHGFYQGIELVDVNKAPATEVAYAVCERLLELGVVCHNTGDYSNVLKVRDIYDISYLL